jgi:hypothetical protein
MGNPSRSEVIEDVAATTIAARIPEVVDNVYQSNPLAVRLMSRDNIILDGGDPIEVPIIYGKKNAGWYRGMGTFNINRKQTKTLMRFDWKGLWANITLPVMDLLKNGGSKGTIKLMDTEMEEAELAMKDQLGSALFSDGTGSGGDELTGLLAVCDDSTNVSTYGKISRDSSEQGTAVKSNYDGIYDTVQSISAVNKFGYMLEYPSIPQYLS